MNKEGKTRHLKNRTREWIKGKGKGKEKENCLPKKDQKSKRCKKN